MADETLVDVLSHGVAMGGMINHGMSHGLNHGLIWINHAMVILNDMD